MKFKLKFQEYQKHFDIFLEKYIKEFKDIPPELAESMRYTLFSGGKRIRPIILLAIYELCGGKDDEVYKFASAIEIIHTYSLIHDDLPSLDDDSIRRGKPCNHVKYGEDTALLSGDALLTLAFKIASSISFDKSSTENIIKCINVLSQAAGCEGMIAGQYLDLNISEDTLDKEKLIKIYKLKTGSLFSAAAEMGAIFSGASEQKIAAAKKYGENLGLCFQFVDDILDNETFNISFFKNPSVIDIVKDLTEQSKKELDIFKNDTLFLKELADSLMFRIY